jgi:LPS sulfotransferase NodH
MARSGSKFLRSLLNQHPDVNDYGEIFHNRESGFDETKTPLKVFSQIALSSEKQPGFQFRYPRHPKEFPEINEIIENAVSGQSLKFILLKRRSKIKAAVSQQNSERLKKDTGKAHLFKSTKYLVEKLSLDVNRALKEALDRERKDDYYVSFVKGKQLDYVEVYYEDLCADPESIVNEIFRFLGLSPLKPGTLQESDLVKVTSDDLPDSLHNFDELKEALSNIDRIGWLDSSINTSGQTRDESFKEGFLSKLPGAKNGDLLYDFNFSLDEGPRVTVKIEAPRVKTNLQFLEHVKDRSDSIVCSQPDLIRTSDDGCRTWTDYEVQGKYNKCFTLACGLHLLQADNGSIHRYDENWSFLDVAKTGSYPWHGTWSIDEDPESGVVIWGEYPYAASEVCLWKSTDQGASWSKVLTVNGDPEDPKGGDIRHFHLVQRCSAIKNRWYASSGDAENQCKFWVSDDDGETWSLIPVNSVDGPGAKDIADSKKNKLYRFTGMIQTDSHLVWPTDDTFAGSGAKLCFMSKRELGQVYVAGGNLGRNEIRNFVQINDRYGLAISEAKLEMESVTLSFIDYRDRVIRSSKKIPNDVLKKANFMNGVSSKSASKGLFYSQNDNKVIRPSAMTLKWSVYID